MIKVTEFELMVLRTIDEHNGRIPLGSGLIAYVAAARRLEKKRLTGKGRYWYATEAGSELLARSVDLTQAYVSERFRRANGPKER